MSEPHATSYQTSQTFHYQLSCISLILLIALLISWEMFLAPLRPHGSWLVFKIVPLLFSIKGVLKRDNYTMQWSSMLILLYFTVGVVLASSDLLALSRYLALAEIALSVLFFCSVLLYLRPHKIAAKKLKAKTTQHNTTS
jgi:uncharacterized membrane protein